MYRNAVLAFLALSLVGFIGWIGVRFTRSVFGVSHEGFLLLILVSLAFVIAICLIEIAFPGKKKQ